jgi:hypothetical protein
LEMDKGDSQVQSRQWPSRCDSLRLKSHLPGHPEDNLYGRRAIFRVVARWRFPGSTPWFAVLALTCRSTTRGHGKTVGLGEQVWPSKGQAPRSAERFASLRTSPRSPSVSPRNGPLAMTEFRNAALAAHWANGACEVNCGRDLLSAESSLAPVPVRRRGHYDWSPFPQEIG